MGTPYMTHNLSSYKLAVFCAWCGVSSMGQDEDVQLKLSHRGNATPVLVEWK